MYYTNVSERQIHYSIFDPLVDMDESLNLKPKLVASWDMTPDGKTITFHLQKGIKFHDGSVLDADAVKFNIDRILDPKTASPQVSNVNAISSVQVVDSMTVSLVLKEAFTPLLANLTQGPGFMSSPQAIQKYGQDYGQHPVGAGPFVLQSWEKGNQITLKRFDGYWQSNLPKLAGMTWKPISDDTVRMANLQSGQSDFVDSVPSNSFATTRANSAFQTWEAAGTLWPMIRLNLKMDPFTNKAARQAVAYGVDRNAIVKAIYFGAAVPAFGPISPIYKTYYDTAVETYGFSYDIAKAKAKVSEAGLSKLEFTVDIQSNPTQQRLAELVKNQLAQANITMNIQAYESTALQDRITNKKYQAVIGSWTPRPDIDGTIYPHFASDGNVNSMSYSNPQVDTLLKSTRTLPNGAARIAAYRDAQKIIVDDAPWVFLIFATQMRAWTKKLSGIPQIPDMMPRFTEAYVSK